MGALPGQELVDLVADGSADGDLALLRSLARSGDAVPISTVQGGALHRDT
jgi:hypothetical protein